MVEVIKKTVWITSLTKVACLVRSGLSHTRCLTCLLYLRCFIMYAHFDCLYTGLFEADCYMSIPQLRRIWASDGNLSGHVLVSIVRLMIETNLATSKGSPSLRCCDASRSFSHRQYRLIANGRPTPCEWFHALSLASRQN